MPTIRRSWGTNLAERSLSFPGDRDAGNFEVALYRGVTIEATAEVVFRWLCQMRAAPYSYDWIDNLGRRSPQRLVPGLEKLARGQRIMYIFRLASFEDGRYLTLRIKEGTLAARIFGDILVSYLVVPQTHGSCRLKIGGIGGNYKAGPTNEDAFKRRFTLRLLKF